jgi:hypothetical protein
VVPALTGTIVIFLDEIDYVRALPIDRDEFFVALRAIYNERPQTPELERLTFCLLGVAAPRDLVRDPHITPFNIGHAIRLLDFSRAEVSAFASALSPLDEESTRWLDEIYRWTKGHPYMTQAMCQEVLRRKAETGTVSERVERAAQARFLRVGRSSDENLSYAEKRLDQSPQKAELLILYRKLLAGDEVLIDTGDPVQQELMMCGMAAPAPRDQSMDGPHTLSVRNNIFAHVFDPVWVREKEAQRLLTTGFRRWQEAGQRDSDLLTGSALQEAQAFAKEHPRELTSQEHEFLLRCLDGVRRQAEQAQLLSEASLAKERLERAEHDRKTQRRIIFGLVVFIVLLGPFSQWDVLSHVLLVHNYHPDTFYSINGSFWSLAVEVQMYLLYPILLRLNGRRGFIRSLLVVGSISVLGMFADRVYGPLGPVFNSSLVRLWVIWVAGAWMAERHHHGLPVFKHHLLLGLGLLVLLPVLNLSILRPFSLRYAFLLLFAVILDYVLVAGMSVRKVRVNAVLKWTVLAIAFMGSCSYSMYLIHQPVLKWFILTIAPAWGATAMWMGVVPLLLLVVGMSYVLYRIVEIPSIRLGRRPRSVQSPS